MNAGYGTPIIVNYGNAQSLSLDGPPAINEILTSGLRASQIGAPSLTSYGRLPIIERVTPHSVDATTTLRDRIARTRVAGTVVIRRAGQIVAGYVNRANPKR